MKFRLPHIAPLIFAVVALGLLISNGAQGLRYLLLLGELPTSGSKSELDEPQIATEFANNPHPELSPQANQVEAEPSAEIANSARPERNLTASAQSSAALNQVLDCTRGSLCPSGTMCAQGPDEQVACFGSNCRGPVESVADCGPQRTCRLLSASNKVYRCVPAGDVALGGPCTDLFPAPQALNCAAGLGCFQGKCREACNRERPCKPGETCITDNAGSSWRASDLCNSDRDCKPQQACVAFGGAGPKTCVPVGTSASAVAGCRPGSCPQNFACDAELVLGQLLGRCRQVCSLEVEGEQCAANSVCAPSTRFFGGVSDSPNVCYASCDANDPRCSAGERCGTVATQSSEATACMPFTSLDEDLLFQTEVASVFASPAGRPSSEGE